MSQPFQLAACAEMLWRDRSMAWRVARLHEMGFGVGLWNWPDHDLAALEKAGASFTIMNGYLEGRLGDDDGAVILLKSASETVKVGKRLGVARLNLHGTGLGAGGIPIVRAEVETGPMWLKARDTLNRICDMAEAEDLVFTLENLNVLDHPGCPFGSTAAVLACGRKFPNFRLPVLIFEITYCGFPDTGLATEPHLGPVQQNSRCS